MQKHFKNFGREIAFLLVMVFVLSSGGLNVFAAANATTTKAKTKISGKTLEVPYELGGYTNRDSITGTALTAAKALVASNRADIGTASGTATAVSVGKQNSTYYSILIAAKQGAKTSYTAIATQITIKAETPSSKQLAQEAAKYIKETTLTVTADVKKGTITLPYQVGGYTSSDMASKAQALVLSALKSTEGKKPTTTLRVQDVSGVNAVISYVQKAFNLKLSAKQPNVPAESTVAIVTVKTQEPTPTQYTKEIGAIVGNSLEIPFSDYGTKTNASRIIAVAENALDSIFDEYKEDETKALGRVTNMDDASVAFTYVYSATGTKKHTFKAAMQQEGHSTTVIKVDDFSIKLGKENNTEIIALAVKEIPDNSTITIPAATADTDAARKAAVLTAVNNMLKNPASQKGYIFPVDLSGVKAEVAYDATFKTYSLKLSKGSAEEEINIKVAGLDLIAAAEAVLRAEGIKIAFNPAAVNNNVLQAQLATQKANDMLKATKDKANDCSAVTAEVVYNGTTEKFDVKLTKGTDDPVTKANVSVIMDADPDITSVSNALAEIVKNNYAITIPFGTYANENAKATAATTAVQTLLNANSKCAGVLATITYNTDTKKYELVLKKGLQTNKDVDDFKINVDPTNPDEKVVIDALALIGTEVEIPFKTYADEVAKAAAATTAAQAKVAATGATVEVKWNATTRCYELVVAKGTEKNEDIKNLTVKLGAAPAPTSANVNAELASGSSWVGGVRGWLVQGGSIELTASTDGEEVTYEWYCVDWSTDAAPVKLTDTGKTITVTPDFGVYGYYVTVKNASGTISSSVFEILIVVPKNPVITSVTPASPVTVTPGESVTITVNATNYKSYNWFFVDWAADVVTELGETTTSITVTAPTEPGAYSYFVGIVSDNWGVAWSNFITIIVE